MLYNDGMIGFVKGIVHAYGLDYVLIDTGNIGYRINFYHPESLSLGKEVTIYTYQNVREDDISLFGFLSLQEYDLFVKLISVKGLGPKIASNILSSASVDSIITAIEKGDIASAETLFVDATKKIDQACTKGVIVKNTAARKKSNLAKKLNAAKA